MTINEKRRIQVICKKKDIKTRIEDERQEGAKESHDIFFFEIFSDCLVLPLPSLRL